MPRALVASFLGATALRADGLRVWSWIALSSLFVGLVIAAVLLAPWRLRFALDAHVLYQQLGNATAKASDAHAWFLAAGFAYQRLRDDNAAQVRAMSVLSAVLCTVMVLQTLAWVLQLVG